MDALDSVTVTTAAGTVVTLGTAFLPGEPQHQVTLRVVGPYGYYLATTVEPDARRYECEACGQPTVYGMEEALLMGLITISD